MIEMRLAEEKDVQFAADCFDCARDYQKELGFVQWTDEYPNIDTAIEDVKSKKGFVFYDETIMIGYTSILSLNPLIAIFKEIGKARKNMPLSTD